MAGKLDGAAQRVPVNHWSVTELVAVVEKEVSESEINNTRESVSSPSFGYTVDEIVSTDVIGITEGSLFDGTQPRLQL